MIIPSNYKPIIVSLFAIGPVSVASKSGRTCIIFNERAWWPTAICSASLASEIIKNGHTHSNYVHSKSVDLLDTDYAYAVVSAIDENGEPVYDRIRTYRIRHIKTRAVYTVTSAGGVLDTVKNDTGKLLSAKVAIVKTILNQFDELMRNGETKSFEVLK